MGISMRDTDGMCFYNIAMFFDDITMVLADVTKCCDWLLQSDAIIMWYILYKFLIIDSP